MTQRFSLRRVNPFLGAVAVVKTPEGRAISVDGHQWQIQVLARPPRSLWSRAGEQTEMQYFRFGVWSESQGLKQVPLNPILDVRRMVATSDALVEQVRAGLDQLPFPFAPELELWLLDQDLLPLALLATAREDTDLEERSVTAWHADGRGEQPFVSPTLADWGLAERGPSGRHYHAEALERLVQTAAGRRLNRQWFRRSEAGGQGLAQGENPVLARRQLPASAFPDLPLRTGWPDVADRRLVADYIAWLAPYLLTLRDMDDDLRGMLEERAVRRPVLMDSLCRLYPKVANPGLLKRARVEARLRRANA